MKREKASSFGQVWKRFTAALLTVMMIAAYMPLAGKAAATDTDSSDYQVIITQRTDAESGFVHPGVGLTKPILENVREQIQNEVDPWYSYYVEMSKHAYAATNVASSNQSAADPTKPDSKAFSSQGFNSRFIQDGLKAYTQALMYVITGEEVYRENGMRIIRIWSQMDPAQYAYFTDSHIHTGIPLNRMVMAAEILRYTSTENPALEWTEQDTTDFTNNLITPVINTFMNSNNYFMNQHNYPILGAMAGYIFSDNKAGYEKEVEWWSVNKDANDQGINGSIKRLFRLVDTNDVTGEPVNPPVVQHIEMGRDQAHGGGDLTNAAIATRMLLAQGTKLDPVEGTVSQAANAVDPMEFLDHRIIKAADYFWQFMLGYEPEWVPVAYSIAPDGTIKDTYNRISSGYKGRFLTANFWDFYSYYTYEKSEDIAEIAPHYAEAFTKKQFLNWQNVDGGDDYWLYLPAEAAADADKFLPPQQPNLGQRNEVEIRYTALDGQTEKLTEGDVQFIRFNATAEGAKIALLSGGTGAKTIGFKIRSNGIAQLDMGTGVKATLTLPDTDGEWRYVTYTMNAAQYMGDFFDLKIRGTAGVTVDMDHISFDAATALNPPVFQLGSSDSEIFSYIGVPINLDFSANGAAAASIVYGSTNLPAGAELDVNTGAFSWEPAATGQYAFVVTASDGTTVTTKNVVIHLSADRNSAIAETIAPYDEHTSYSETSLAGYKAVYEETISKSAVLSDEEFIQQLLVLRSAVEGLQLVSPQAFDGSLDFTKAIQGVSVLLDGDNDTFWGFATGPQPNRILDFGADFKVSADAFAVQSRMNFTDRGAGIAIYGSNDAVNWTKLTPEQTPFNSGLNRIEVAGQLKQEKYRYIKMQMDTKHRDIIHNSVQGILEIGEFRIYGERHEAGNRIESISFDTSQSNKGKVVAGDTVKVNIKATEEISNVRVKIQGIDAQVYTEDGINWTASIVMGTETASGLLSQVIVEYNQKNGQPGATAYSTTDNSKLNFVNESDIIQNVLAITDVTGSDARYDAANMKTRMQALFDNNELTFTEFWGLAANGHGSFVTFDFRAGHQVEFSGVEFLARRDQLGRLAGAYIQGSNDMVTWTTLTDAAAGISDWQYLASKDTTTKYRYIRINNPLFWFGNMAEVRFHGEVISTLPDLLKQAQEIDRSLYTAASLTNLDAAISGGEAVIANSAATEADVSAAIAGLQAALQALEYEQGMPVLELADQLVVAGDELAFNVQAVNVDAAAEVVEELPEGAAFDAGTHRFTWTPAMEQGGVYMLTFKATAGDKASEKTIKIKVIGKPVVDVNEPVEPIAAKVGQMITYQVPVLPDASGEPLVFTAAQLPTGAVINSINGMFKWTPTNVDYGAHSIIFKASNGSFEVEVPVQLNIALNILPAGNYTQGSYDAYRSELARIEAELNKPGADKAALARQIAIAEKALVRAPLPVYSVVKDQDGSDIELITDIKSGTTELAEGKFESGRSVSFKGGINDYLQLSAEPPFKNYDEVTIATWVKWDGGSDWQRIFDFGNNTNQYLFLTPKSGNNTLRFAIKNGGAEQFIQTSAMPTNQWVHVAITLGGGTGKLYVNGELKATGNMSIKLSDIKPGLNYIAKSQFAADALFRGSVDRFTVYNYVLSEAEVQASMTAPVQWVDKTLLESQLAQADQLLQAADEQTPEEAVEELQAAVEAAGLVLVDVEATQAAVDSAAAILKQAINAYKAATKPTVNKSDLNDLIAEAVAVLADAEEGSEPGQYPSAAMEALEDAIAAAQAVGEKADATQQEVDSALAGLEQALADFAASVNEEPAGPVQGVDKASLTGAAEAYVGEPLDLNVGLGSVTAGFTLLETVVHYDPLKFAVATVEHEGKLSLASEALSVHGDTLQVLGTAVKPEQGQVYIILASVDGPVTEGGELFTLHGSILAEATAGALQTSLSDFAVSFEADRTLIDVSEAQLTVDVKLANKAALTEKIAEAQELYDSTTQGNAPGQYPEAARTAFAAAIAAAVAVNNNDQAAQSEVNTAFAELAAAIGSYQAAVVQGAPVNKAELHTAIAAAQAKLERAVIGSKLGQYPQQAADELSAAIAAAQLVNNSGSVSQDQVDQAVQTLRAALQAFGTKLITLVPGSGKITIRDLSMLVKYYGVSNQDANWNEIAKADVIGAGKIDILVLAAIAQMILDDWLME